MILKDYIKYNVISELKTYYIGNSKNNRRKTLFVYKQYAFVFDDYQSIDAINGYLKNNKNFDFSEVIDSIKKHKIGTDYFFGNINDDVLIISDDSPFIHSPISSILIKKIMKQFNLSKVSYPYSDGSYEEEIEYDKKNILGKLPEIVYHGTNSKSLKNILKFGLIPGAKNKKSNYEGVNHDNVVSLSVDIHSTYYHAKIASENYGGFPIILGFSIPDKSKIVQDYDVDNETEQTGFYSDIGYDSPEESNARKGRGSYKTSLDVGTIGYIGRIPANFIKEIYFWSENRNIWKKSNIQAILKMNNRY